MTSTTSQPVKGGTITKPEPRPLLKSLIKELEKEKNALEQEVQKLTKKNSNFEKLSESYNQILKENDNLKTQMLEMEKKSDKIEKRAERFERQAEDLRNRVIEKKPLGSKYDINKKLAEANLSLNQQVKELMAEAKENTKAHRLEIHTLKSTVDEQAMNIRTLQYLNDELETKYENAKKVIEANKEMSKELKKFTSKKCNQDDFLKNFIQLIRQKEERTGELENRKITPQIKLDNERLVETNLNLSKQVKELSDNALKLNFEASQSVAKIADLEMSIRTLQFLNEELEKKSEKYKKILDSNKEISKELKKLSNRKSVSDEDDFLDNIITIHEENEELKKSLLERYEDEDLMFEVKKFLNQSQLAFLRNPKSQIIEWKSEDVSEAVNLYACSPAAYTLLKSKGFPLPAESVLQKWTDQQKQQQQQKIQLVPLNSIEAGSSCDIIQEDDITQSPKRIKLEPEPEPEPSSSDIQMAEIKPELLTVIKQEKVEEEEISVVDFVPQKLASEYVQEIKEENEIHFVLKEEIP